MTLVSFVGEVQNIIIIKLGHEFYWMITMFIIILHLLSFSQIMQFMFIEKVLKAKDVTWLKINKNNFNHSALSEGTHLLNFKLPIAYFWHLVILSEYLTSLISNYDCIDRGLNSVTVQNPITLFYRVLEKNILWHFP